jgi:hypothetical protein
LFSKLFNKWRKMKIERIISAFVIAFALLFNQFGSASAKPQPVSMAAAFKCNFSPLKPTGFAPAEIVFTADYNGSDVDSYLWTFGDGNSASGPVVENTFIKKSSPHVRLQVWFVDGTSIQCSTWGNIMEPVKTVPVAPAPKGQGNSNSGSAANMGDDNLAPVINGNNNQININPDPIVIVITPSPTAITTATPTPTVTPTAPVVPDNSCNGYCASNGGVININPTPAQNSPAVKTVQPIRRDVYLCHDDGTCHLARIGGLAC